VDFKKYLASTVAAGALLAFSAPVDAVAGAINSNNSKIALKIGGRVHKALIHADDGVRDALFFVDGRSSNTEIWFAGSAKLTETVTMGAYQRFDVANQGGSYSFGSGTGAAVNTSTTHGAKYSYVYFKHSTMGTVSMGDLEPGSNGTMNGNGGGFTNNPGSQAGGMDITSGTSAWATSDEISDFLTLADGGADSNNRILYSSPSMGGFSFAADVEQDGGSSIGLKWSGSVGGLTAKITGGSDWDGSANNLTGGAIVLSHASGLHASVNHYKYDLDVETTTATDYDGTTVNVGYKTKVNSLGATNIAVSYHETDDKTGSGDEGESHRFGVTQALEAVGGSIGLQYESLSFSDSASTDYNDIDTLGLEISFNF